MTMPEWDAAIGPLLSEETAGQVISRENLARAIVVEDRGGARWVPAWQFDHGRPVRGLAQAFSMLVADGAVSPWSALSWCVHPHPELAGASPREWAASDGDPERLLLVARRDAAAAGAVLEPEPEREPAHEGPETGAAGSAPSTTAGDTLAEHADRPGPSELCSPGAPGRDGSEERAEDAARLDEIGRARNAGDDPELAQRRARQRRMLAAGPDPHASAVLEAREQLERHEP